jgi:hypothetical protein
MLVPPAFVGGRVALPISKLVRGSGRELVF